MLYSTNLKQNNIYVFRCEECGGEIEMNMINDEPVIISPNKKVKCKNCQIIMFAQIYKTDSDYDNDYSSNEDLILFSDSSYDDSDDSLFVSTDSFESEEDTADF